MKKLTGKCFESFGDKCQYQYEDFLKLPESCQNALIIEFFDSVGFKITIIPTMFDDDWGSDIFEYTECLQLGFDSRIKATNEAILKANQLYNEL